MGEWLSQHSTAIIWSTIGSIVVMIASTVGMVWTIVHVPADYFSTDHPPAKWNAKRVAKNVLGVILLVSGIVMLFLPGQGILGILAGIMLVDFPGKQRVQRAIVRRPRVLRTMNWVRKKFGKPELEKPPKPEKSDKH